MSGTGGWGEMVAKSQPPTALRHNFVDTRFAKTERMIESDAWAFYLGFKRAGYG